MNKIKYHTLQWFKNRQRKTVYRKDVHCPCDTCKTITKEGLKIIDENHCEYLLNIQHELKIEYRDRPYKSYY